MRGGVKLACSTSFNAPCWEEEELEESRAVIEGGRGG